MKGALFKKTFLILTKWLPVIGSFLMTIHYGWYAITGNRTPFPEYICGASLFTLTYIISSSILFDFCKWHKLCIGYLAIGSLLFNLHTWFPEIFEYERVWGMFMFVLGLGLLLLIALRKVIKI